MTFGVYSSFLLQQNHFVGGTPLRYSFVGGLSVGACLAAAPLGKILIKRFGFRVPILLGMTGHIRPKVRWGMLMYG